MHRAWEEGDGRTMSTYDFNQFRQQGMSEAEVRAWADRHGMLMPTTVPGPRGAAATASDHLSRRRAAYDARAARLRQAGKSYREVTRALGPRP